MLDLIVIGLLQAVAGDPAPVAPIETPAVSSDAAQPSSDVAVTPNATGDTEPRQRVCRNVVSGQSRLGASRRRDCNRQSDASRSDHDRDTVSDATARTYAPRDPGS